jgi:hypothetical protein
MGERAEQLHVAIEGQLVELTALLSTADDAVLHLPCGAREKLGDGTVAANAWHTADNYRRIADFINNSDQVAGSDKPAMRPAHRMPRLLRAIGHRAPSHGPNAAGHDQRYSADDIDVPAVLEQLAATRGDLSRVGQLTDQQLDAIPPKGSFRFCDGQRSLEQVLASLVKHQAHQLDALTVALG